MIKDVNNGTYAYCNVNEGLGKVLRFGAYSEEVLNRLAWIRDEFAPALHKALALTDGIDIQLITAQALQMGDECHNRNKAATSLFYKQISLLLLQAVEDKEVLERVLSFIAGNDHYFLNLSMPACKICLAAGQGVEYATVLTVMARNGVNFGIKVSGLRKRNGLRESPTILRDFTSRATAKRMQTEISETARSRRRWGSAASPWAALRQLYSLLEEQRMMRWQCPEKCTVSAWTVTGICSAKLEFQGKCNGN